MECRVTPDFTLPANLTNPKDAPINLLRGGRKS